MLKLRLKKLFLVILHVYVFIQPYTALASSFAGHEINKKSQSHTSFHNSILSNKTQLQQDLESKLNSKDFVEVNKKDQTLIDNVRSQESLHRLLSRAPSSSKKNSSSIIIPNDSLIKRLNNELQKNDGPQTERKDRTKSNYFLPHKERGGQTERKNADKTESSGLNYIQIKKLEQTINSWHSKNLLNHKSPKGQNDSAKSKDFLSNGKRGAETSRQPQPQSSLFNNKNKFQTNVQNSAESKSSVLNPEPINQKKTSQPDFVVPNYINDKDLDPNFLKKINEAKQNTKLDLNNQLSNKSKKKVSFGDSFPSSQYFLNKKSGSVVDNKLQPAKNPTRAEQNFKQAFEKANRESLRMSIKLVGSQENSSEDEKLEVVTVRYTDRDESSASRESSGVTDVRVLPIDNDDKFQFLRQGKDENLKKSTILETIDEERGRGSRGQRSDKKDADLRKNTQIPQSDVKKYSKTFVVVPPLNLSFVEKPNKKNKGSLRKSVRFKDDHPLAQDNLHKSFGQNSSKDQLHKQDIESHEYVELEVVEESVDLSDSKSQVEKQPNNFESSVKGSIISNSGNNSFLKDDRRSVAESSVKKRDTGKQRQSFASFADPQNSFKDFKNFNSGQKKDFSFVDNSRSAVQSSAKTRDRAMPRIDYPSFVDSQNSFKDSKKFNFASFAQNSNNKDSKDQISENKALADSYVNPFGAPEVNKMDEKESDKNSSNYSPHKQRRTSQQRLDYGQKQVKTAIPTNQTSNAVKPKVKRGNKGCQLLEDRFGEDKNTSEQNPESSISRSRSPLIIKDDRQSILKSRIGILKQQSEVALRPFTESVVEGINNDLKENIITKEKYCKYRVVLEKEIHNNIKDEIINIIDALVQQKEEITNRILQISSNYSTTLDNNYDKEELETLESIDTILTKNIKELKSKKHTDIQILINEASQEQGEKEIINQQEDIVDIIQKNLNNSGNIEDNIKNSIEQKLKEFAAIKVYSFNENIKILENELAITQQNLEELTNLKDEDNRRKEQNFSAPPKNDSFVSEKKVNTLINTQDKKNNVLFVESLIGDQILETEQQIFAKDKQIKENIKKFKEANVEEKIKLLEENKILKEEKKRLESSIQPKDSFAILDNAHKKSKALLNDIVQSQGVETPRKQDNSPHITDTDRSYYTNATHGTYDSAKNTLELAKEVVVEREFIIKNLQDNIIRKNAATKIQAAWRGKTARKEVKKMKDKQDKQDKINQFQERVENEKKKAFFNQLKKEVTAKEVAAKEVAATKIQAAWRGRKARKKLEDIKKLAQQKLMEELNKQNTNQVLLQQMEELERKNSQNVYHSEQSSERDNESEKENSLHDLVQENNRENNRENIPKNESEKSNQLSEIGDKKPCKAFAEEGEYQNDCMQSYDLKLNENLLHKELEDESRKFKTEIIPRQQGNLKLKTSHSNILKSEQENQQEFNDFLQLKTNYTDNGKERVKSGDRRQNIFGSDSGSQESVVTEDIYFEILVAQDSLEEDQKQQTLNQVQGEPEIDPVKFLFLQRGAEQRAQKKLEDVNNPVKSKKKKFYHPIKKDNFGEKPTDFIEALSTLNNLHNLPEARRRQEEARRQQEEVRRQQEEAKREKDEAQRQKEKTKEDRFKSKYEKKLKKQERQKKAELKKRQEEEGILNAIKKLFKNAETEEAKMQRELKEAQRLQAAAAAKRLAEEKAQKLKPLREQQAQYQAILNTEAVAKYAEDQRQEKLEDQRQEKLEAQRQEKLAAKRQAEEEAKMKRELEAKREKDEAKKKQEEDEAEIKRRAAEEAEDKRQRELEAQKQKPQNKHAVGLKNILKKKAEAKMQRELEEDQRQKKAKNTARVRELTEGLDRIKRRSEETERQEAAKRQQQAEEAQRQAAEEAKMQKKLKEAQDRIKQQHEQYKIEKKNQAKIKSDELLNKLKVKLKTQLNERITLIKKKQEEEEDQRLKEDKRREEEAKRREEEVEALSFVSNLFNAEEEDEQVVAQQTSITASTTINQPAVSNPPAGSLPPVVSSTPVGSPPKPKVEVLHQEDNNDEVKTDTKNEAEVKNTDSDIGQELEDNVSLLSRGSILRTHSGVTGGKAGIKLFFSKGTKVSAAPCISYFGKNFAVGCSYYAPRIEKSNATQHIITSSSSLDLGSFLYGYGHFDYNITSRKSNAHISLGAKIPVSSNLKLMAEIDVMHNKNLGSLGINFINNNLNSEFFVCLSKDKSFNFISNSSVDFGFWSLSLGFSQKGGFMEMGFKF